MTAKQSANNTLFRITVWPGKLPLPTFQQTDYALDISRGALLFNTSPERRRPADDDEIYLRLSKVDLDDPDAILAFANTYGHLDGAELQLRYSDNLWLLLTGPDEEIREQQRAALIRDQPQRFNDFELLEDFRTAARLLGELTSAWQVASGGADPASIEWALGPVADEREAVQCLAAHLPLLLSRHGPTLEINDETPNTPNPENAHSRLAERTPPDIQIGPLHTFSFLFEVCATELFNHIAGNAQYLTCANETCRRRFVLQQGRAVHRQHRTTGVKYCSASCANAQAQRAARRRAARKTERNPG